jgi:hypothetical protein
MMIRACAGLAIGCLTAAAPAAVIGVFSDGFGDGDRDNNGLDAGATATDPSDVGIPWLLTDGTSAVNFRAIDDSAGIGAGNALQLTGTQWGTSARLTFAFELDGVAAATQLGFNGTPYAGVDVAGTINGNSAIGVGRLLTADPAAIGGTNDAEGLAVLYSGTTPPETADVTYVLGWAGCCSIEPTRWYRRATDRSKRTRTPSRARSIRRTNAPRRPSAVWINSATPWSNALQPWKLPCRGSSRRVTLWSVSSIRFSSRAAEPIVRL